MTLNGRLGAVALFLSIATTAPAQTARPASGGALPPWFVQINHRIDPEKYLEVKRTDMPDLDLQTRSTVRLTNLTGGVLVDADGHVVTRLVNYDPRVTDLELSVTSNDGRKLPATLVGLDAPSGFVVLHVPGLRGTPPAPGGPAPSIEPVGDVRISRRDYSVPIPVRSQAPGRAQAKVPSVMPTLPLVAGTVDARALPADLARTGALSTITSGALVPSGDMSLVLGASGSLLGIARYERPGRGSLVPIAFLRDVVMRRVLDARGTVASGWLGADGVSVSDLPAERRDPRAPSGVVLRGVVANGPAAKAGLRVDDVITSFDGVPVRTIAELGALVRGTPAGTSVPIAIVRGGAASDLAAVLGRRPATAPIRLAATAPDFGIKILDMNPQLAEFLGVTNGVFVEFVREGTPAGLAGLRAGDVITMVGDRPITNRSAFNAAVVEASAPTVTISVHREKKDVLLNLSLTSPQ